MWNTFLTSNETKYRLARTIVQGILGVLCANLDYLIEVLHFSAEFKVIVVAIVMAILSPIMAEIGLYTTEVATNDEIIEEAD